ncbi:MAG: molecular chaperone GroES [Bryobacterales bacterium]|nr:molecular chaperone GroES [Bryobacterales bacterium]
MTLPKTREQIKQERQHALPYRSPHHEDGGWHATPGAKQYVDWEPLGDHILVEFVAEEIPFEHVVIPEGASLVSPDMRRAIVRKVSTTERLDVHEALRRVELVKVGDLVIVGQYSDWESADGRLGLFQEGDVRSVIVDSFFQPLFDRILVERIADDEQSAGGIIIPDSAREKLPEGRVVATGPGRMKGERLMPVSVAVGDRVLFGKYAGTELVFEGREYLVLRDDEILAKSA